MTLLSARVILGQTTDNHNKEVEEEANNDAINKDKVFPEDEPINSVASYSKNSLENTTQGNQNIKGFKTSKQVDVSTSKPTFVEKLLIRICPLNNPYYIPTLQRPTHPQQKTLKKINFSLFYWPLISRRS